MSGLSVLEKRIYEDRIYEGEWFFVCRPCGTYLVEYSFYEFDKLADHFLSNKGCHATEPCHTCAGPLEWAGFSGDMPISESLVSLIKKGQFMAATVILSSITENAINNLLWAALVDSGIEKRKANGITNGRINRGDAIEMIRSLTQWTVKDIAFPVRNLVAHGKGFGKQEVYYREEIKKQAISIRQWIKRIFDEVQPNNFWPTECERWLLFMNHWSSWLLSYLEQDAC